MPRRAALGAERPSRRPAADRRGSASADALSSAARVHRPRRAVGGGRVAQTASASTASTRTYRHPLADNHHPSDTDSAAAAASRPAPRARRPQTARQRAGMRPSAAGDHLRITERAPQLGDLRLQRVAARGDRVLGPHVLDEPVRAHERPGLEREADQQLRGLTARHGTGRPSRLTSTGPSTEMWNTARVYGADVSAVSARCQRPSRWWPHAADALQSICSISSPSVTPPRSPRSSRRRAPATTR